MQNLVVRKTERLAGAISAPPSKAYSHRAIIASSLANGQSVISKPSNCVDVLTTIRACRMFGARIKRERGGSLSVKGTVEPKTPDNIVNCKGSGSTMRFLTPVFALAEGSTVLTGDESLRRRPMQPLLEALGQLGVRCFSTRGDGKAPLVVCGGGIKGGRARLMGDVSSQFASGLLFSCPTAESKTTIELETRLESKPYTAMTIDTLRKHGILVDCAKDFQRFSVSQGQEYLPTNHSVEGDYSSAAFMLAALAITKSKGKVVNLPEHSLQGDKIIIGVLRAMGVTMNVDGESVEVSGLSKELSAVDLDLRDAPDLVPVCAVLACFASGETTLKGVERLRLKESDRIDSLISEMGKMGGQIMTEKNNLIINGNGKLHGAKTCAHNDHRIAMACAVAGLGAEGETAIQGIECVRKSYVDFVRDLRSLGGKIIGG